jgi:hypothetical protein
VSRYGHFADVSNLPDLFIGEPHAQKSYYFHVAKRKIVLDTKFTDPAVGKTAEDRLGNGTVTMHSFPAVVLRAPELVIRERQFRLGEFGDHTTSL